MKKGKDDLVTIHGRGSKTKDCQFVRRTREKKGDGAASLVSVKLDKKKNYKERED